jgi:heme o synthase
MQGISTVTELTAGPQVVGRAPLAVLSDVFSLAKPRLSSLVLLTAAGGQLLSRTPMSMASWLWSLLGIALVVASANAANCILERKSDLLMRRTATRPLPTGRLKTGEAVVFCVVTLAIALPLLAFQVNRLTAALALLAWVSYVAFYTPMKAISAWSIAVGAIPGALPPLMGWTAATGKIETPGLVLFGVLFFWQLPHFIAISIFRKAEYANAGLTSVPLSQGDAVARALGLLTSLPLIPLSLALPLLDVTGWIFGSISFVAAGAFVWVALEGVVRQGGDDWAKRLFKMSLVYLTVVMLSLAAQRFLGLP